MKPTDNCSGSPTLAIAYGLYLFVVPATFGIPLENVTIAQGVILLSCNASAGAKQAKQTTAIRQSEIIVFFFICFVLSHSEIIGSFLTLYL